MQTKEKLLIAIPFLAQLLNVIQTTLVHGITAGDWVRHSAWIIQYLSLDFSPLRTYPPLFHFFMIPSYLILRDNIFILQPLFFSLSFFSILYFVNKYENKYAVILTAIILGTSVNFLQYSHALMPQWIDFVLFPIIFILFKQKKYSLSAFYLWFIQGTHLAGIVFFFIMFFYSLLVDRKYLKYLLIVFILATPFYVTSYAIHILSPDGLRSSALWNFPNKLDYPDVFDYYHSYPPVRFLVLSGLLLWVSLPVTIYAMFKMKKFNKIQLFYVIWFLAFTPLLIFAWWRGWSFLIVPATLFVSSVISKYIDFYDCRKKEQRTD